MSEELRAALVGVGIMVVVLCIAVGLWALLVWVAAKALAGLL